MEDSRDINKCQEDLIIAFSDSKEIFENRHPELKVICTCSTRSNESQDKLYSSGRTIDGPKLTNAKAGESPHNYEPSLAFDIAVLQGKIALWDEKYCKEFADILLSTHPKVEWGGNFKSFKDLPHFQLVNYKKYI